MGQGFCIDSLSFLKVDVRCYIPADVVYRSDTKVPSFSPLSSLNLHPLSTFEKGGRFRDLGVGLWFEVSLQWLM